MLTQEKKLKLGVLSCGPRRILPYLLKANTTRKMTKPNTEMR